MADKKKSRTHQEKVRGTSMRLLKEIVNSEGILEAIGDAVSIQDRTFKILYENQAHKDMLGNHEGEYCYTAYQERKDICDGCNLALTFRDGGVHKVLRELQTGKKTRYFEITSSPLRDTKGRIIAGIEVVRDITERKKADKLITDALAFNKTILKTSPIGIVTFKASGQCVSANEAIASMVGGTVEQLLKQNFHHLKSWKMSRMLEAAKEVLATGAEKTMDVNVVSTFGKEVWFACRFVPFQFEDETHLLALFTDISKRKRVEEELRKSEQQLRNLTAYVQKVAEIERTNIAREIHDELGQALTVLKIDLSWLKKKLPNGQNPMLEKTNTMLKITDRTIETMKRISSNLRPGILDDLGLAAAIEWQAEEFQKQTGINCKVAVDAKDITLDRDRNTAIFRIFQETLTNVARHAKATKVSVSLKEKDEQIKLTVKDNGRGITEEEITHPKSYGLIGITERAKILNGHSIIEGVRGKGTTVTVTIPIHEKRKKIAILFNNTS
jgi:PAS domain S-box-containing protein